MTTNKNYIKAIVNDYCVLDTETTGLSAYYDDVIEIGILKVRNDEIVEKYSQLIKPKNEIDSFITELTGISNDMVRDKPSLMSVKEDVLNFLGNDIIIGHNTSFDIRFLKEGFKCDLENKYMDTMQFSRKLFPDLKHHRLSDLTEYLGLKNNEHRALSDSTSTKELYDAMKSIMAEKGLTIDDLWVNRNKRKGIDVDSIRPTMMDIDENNFFYNRHVVFTGKLEKCQEKKRCN